MTDDDRKPRGEMQIRTVAMPSDTNPNGDIFGGWVLSQMDLAGGTAASLKARGRVATVAIEGMSFHKPVRVGDVLCCYADLERIGRTSLALHVEAWALRSRSYEAKRVLVTEGEFVFVALDPEGKPRPLKSEG
ncbi:MAG: acyl-CoA thioesterase [Rhodospirillaceae bacterium]|nr:acyl-CoA thioesterase [Rhodospirillaceae bacterium]MBT6137121.1 acyl-CoA thioesterase [Rhodospirillaceae bacterium]